MTQRELHGALLNYINSPNNSTRNRLINSLNKLLNNKGPNGNNKGPNGNNKGPNGNNVSIPRNTPWKRTLPNGQNVYTSTNNPNNRNYYLKKVNSNNYIKNGVTYRWNRTMFIPVLLE